MERTFPGLVGDGKKRDFLADWRDLRRVMRKVEKSLRNEYKLIPLK
jgi:TIR domain-containing protein